MKNKRYPNMIEKDKRSKDVGKQDNITSDNIIERLQKDIAGYKVALDEMRLLSEHLIELQEKELGKIGRRLHDETGQSLTIIKLMLEKAKKLPPQQIYFELDNIIEQVTGITREISNLSVELRPPILDDLGLIPTLEGLFRRLKNVSGLAVEFEHSEPNSNFPLRVNIAVYRIVQEALKNVINHSGVKRVKVTLRSDEAKLVFSVSDEGSGFDIKNVTNYRGLTGMRNRTELLGGKFAVESSPGSGTRITVEIPSSNTH